MRGRFALALVFVLLVPAGNAHAELGAQPTQASAAGDLFVLTAAAGRLERVPGRQGAFRLVLRRPARNATGFTDRPTRRTGQQPLTQFIRRWRQLGFADVPPNAAVVLANAPRNRDVLIVELSGPRVGGGGRTLVFRAKVLEGNPTGGLRGFTRSADRRIAARFGRASLFIDPGGRELSLNFTLSNIPPGGSVSISFINAQIDLSGDLFAGADAPTRFGASTVSFVLTAGTSSPANGSVTTAINVTAGANCILGTALITAGATATVRVSPNQQSTQVANGRFCLPFN